MAKGLAISPARDLRASAVQFGIVVKICDIFYCRRGNEELTSFNALCGAGDSGNQETKRIVMTMNTSNDSAGRLPVIPAITYRILIILGFVGFLGAALVVPFYYETQTLWYKFGAGKIMLRTGQLAGMLALVLVVLQITLSIRGKFPEDLFGGANLMRWHRTNGVLIAFVAISHVALVLLPEGLDNLPIGKKYWPEMIGEALFLLILLMVLSSHFRSTWKLDYKKWKNLHRPLGYLVAVLVLMHVLFVSRSFEQGAPRFVLLSVFTGLGLLLAAVKIIRGKSR